MTPGAMKQKPTAGALRAARELQPDASLVESTAEVIDRQTGLREVLELLEGIIAEAGDIIEGRSPELVAQVRTAIRHSGYQDLREAE